MKTIYLSLVAMFLTHLGLSQLPNLIPSKLINTVMCGNLETTGKMQNGYTSFNEFPVKIYISNDGIQAEYNPGEKYGKNRWDKTQVISKFKLIKKTPNLTYDKSQIMGYIYEYEVLDKYKTNHSIVSLNISTFNDGRDNVLDLILTVPSYKNVTFSSHNPKFIICEKILTKAEIIENNKKEELRIKKEKEDIENRKKFEAKLIEKVKIETEKNSNDTVSLSNEIIIDFIKNNKDQLNTLKAGKYIFNFNFSGACSNKNFSGISSNVPFKFIGIENLNKINIGDPFKGGVVITITDNQLLLASPKPIGSGNFSTALDLCEKYKVENLKWRLPNLEEIQSIFSLKDKLDSYENNWYWTNNENGDNAEHIGIRYGDHTFVPKKDGKFIFCVTAIDYLKVPLNSKIEIIISEENEQLVKTEFFSSSEKPFFQKNSKEYFYKSKNYPICNYKYNNTISKNVVREVKTIKNIKKANSLITFEEEKTLSNDYIILKKE